MSPIERVIFDQLLRQERTEVAIAFYELIWLKFDLIKLFYLKGLSQKISHGTNITAFHNALDAIEQDPQNFFEHIHSAMCSEKKRAFGEMVQNFINDTRKAHAQIFTKDFLQFTMYQCINVHGMVEMLGSMEQFYNLVKMETQHICNISIPISSYLDI
jgi:hypothetical protein